MSLEDKQAQMRQRNGAVLGTLNYGLIFGSNNRHGMLVKENKTKDRNYFVYALADPRTGDFFYVGRTRNVGMRLYQHLSLAHAANVKNDDYSSKMWELAECGISPVFCVLEVTEDASREEFHIDRLWAMGYPLTNINKSPQTKVC